MSGDQPDAASIRITTTPEQVIDFLERLADDDKFRTRFEENTVEVLAEYGIAIPSERVPEGVAAPPKEELAEMRDRLYAARDSGEELYRFGDWGLIFFSFFGLRSFRRFAPPPEE